MEEGDGEQGQAGEIVVRAARDEDKDAVLAFSSTTFDGEDYIPYVWDDWLHADAAPGALLVAVDGGGSAVVCVAVRAMAEAGVCEMKRLHLDPAARGAGIGQRNTTSR